MLMMHARIKLPRRVVLNYHLYQLESMSIDLSVLKNVVAVAWH
jgi:hypothetical protein